jgi:hypothetical protein
MFLPLEYFVWHFAPVRQNRFLPPQQRGSEEGVRGKRCPPDVLAAGCNHPSTAARAALVGTPSIC